MKKSSQILPSYLSTISFKILKKITINSRRKNITIQDRVSNDAFPELHSHALPFHPLPTTAINAVWLVQLTAKMVPQLIEMLVLGKKYSYNIQWGETFPPHQAVQQRTGLTACQEESEGSPSSFVQENRGWKKEWPCLCQENRLGCTLPGTSCRCASSYFENNHLENTPLHGNCTAQVPWCLQNFQGMKGVGRSARMDQESPKIHEYERLQSK